VHEKIIARSVHEIILLYFQTASISFKTSVNFVHINKIYLNCTQFYSLYTHYQGSTDVDRFQNLIIRRSVLLKIRVREKGNLQEHI